MVDATKTAVISQTGMGQAIGLAARGHSIRKFAFGQVMAEFISTEILEKLENPLKFQHRPGGTENLVVEVRDSARALPPFSPPLRPSDTAAGSFPSSVLTSTASPVAIAAIRCASWFVSRGLFVFVVIQA